jgi:hypothetical protein
MPVRYLYFAANSFTATLKPAGLDKSKGLITTNSVKDPTEPHWKDDPGVKEYAAFIAKYMSPTDLIDNSAVIGFGAAVVLIQGFEAVRRRPVAPEHHAAGGQPQRLRIANAAAGHQGQHFARQLPSDPPNAARHV